MFLKYIKLQGFKSFNEPTQIDFDHNGFTVIVGPNGSGKSNISDAFKWVLGEQSKKSIRATNFDDIIFVGSETKKKADFAEVALVFNNEKRILNIDFDEVEIMRRVYRSQEQSEFYINKTPVRRKDIRNLFLDTGLGTIDLAVISQGSVTKITEAKPDELRELINEAAGVARFSQQKEESLRKLEKVDQNLEIFSVKLEELNKQIKPLEKQKEKAEKYLKFKTQLEEIELSLIKELLQKDLKDQSEYKLNIENFTNQKNNADSKVEEIINRSKELQTKAIEIDKNLFNLQNKQFELSSNVNVNSATLSTDEQLENDIKKIVTSIETIKTTIADNNEKSVLYSNNIVSEQSKLDSVLKMKEENFYKLNLIEFELEKIKQQDDSKIDRATKTILENSSIFPTVYGLVDNLITFENEYRKAIHLTLKQKLYNIVVSDEQVIKNIISFLKENKLGSATLIPASKVQPKNIPNDLELVLQGQDGYLGTLASNIKTQQKFQNVIDHLAGNILVFDVFDNALLAAKLINYRFQIITLEGDVIFPGFVVRGGYTAEKNIAGDIDKLVQNQKIFTNDLKKISTEIENCQAHITQFNESLNLNKNEEARLLERKSSLEITLINLLEQFKKTKGYEFSINSIGNSDIKEFQNISLESIGIEIRKLQDLKITNHSELLTLQDQEEVSRKAWQEAIEKISSNQILLEKVILKIDENLNILSRDYKMTYETLKSKTDIEVLKISFEEASVLREGLRSQISNLGFVNVEAINEYEELSKDFNLLKSNNDDLIESKEKLISTISTIDDEMKKRFETTFEKINESLDKIFQILFKGGQAKLKYENPEDILNSGIEFTGQTPGKIVRNIRLYSGGERSLMALSLIFAINEVKQLPILLLDEVEAALDEANVERFANFAKQINELGTQTIVITHRPGTMEKSDVLYGVTMQEKGISKIVSVKLEEAIEMAS